MFSPAVLTASRATSLVTGFTLFSLQEALAEVIACFPVYRTYICGVKNMVGDEDHHISFLPFARPNAEPGNERIHLRLRRFCPAAQDPEGISEDRAARRDFVMRFQQITGPIGPKGSRTPPSIAFSLASLNEVGES
jgi:(1->4)-alpha-D-glucan 1-alpha-D-glucosylmutase